MAEDYTYAGQYQEEDRVAGETGDFDMLSPVAIAAKNLMVVYWFLDRVPIVALPPLASTLQDLLYSSLCEHLGVDLAGNDASQAIVNNFRHFEGFLHQFIDITASSSDHSVIPTVTEAAVQSTYALIEIARRLVLWLLLDKDNNDQIDAFLQRFAKVLLEKITLYQSYQTWVEWLHERANDFLYGYGRSVDRLVAGIVELVSSCETAGAILELGQCDREQLQELSTSDGSDYIAVDLKAFVAQVRELYISASRLSPSSLRPLRLDVPPPVNLQPPVSLSAQSESCIQFTGTWLCQLDTLSAKRLQLSPFHQDSIGTLSFLWLLRQFMCVRLVFTKESTMPTLLISSVFKTRMAAASRDDQCTRIVLDQQHHWCRCFPGGESSLAVCIGGRSFGDYVGSVADGAINVRWYAWPTAGSTETTRVRASSSSLFSAEFAINWYWQPAINSDDTTQLSAKVTVERSANPVTYIQSSHLLDLSMEPLSSKLALVESWVLLCEYQICYRRVE